MNTDSRQKNSTRNFLVGITYQIIILVLNLISKTYFIRTLGTIYLGVNGLFTNIFLVLSFVEYGIGPIMMYTLYGPFSQNDKSMIVMIYNFYKKLYRKMALIILAAGLLLLPILPWMINSPDKVSNVQFAFFLFLCGIVISNLFAYNTHLIVSDQRKYVISMYQFWFDAAAMILQIFILIWTQNYLLYLCVLLIKNLVLGGMISRLAKKLYPFIKISLPETEDFIRVKKEIIKKNKSIIIYRFSRVMLTGTDNILISVLVGTIYVGLYSNYDLIVVGVSMLVTTFYSAITASIGNLLAKESIEEQNRIYDIVQTISHWIVGFTTTCLLVLFQDFVTIWLGNELLIDKYVVLVIVINYYLVCNRNVIKVFSNAAGIFERIKNMMVIAAIMNIILSILLGMWFGLIGILIATSITTVSTFYWYEAKIVIVEKLGRDFSLFFKHQAIGIGLTFLNILIVSLAVFPIQGTGLWTFILKAFVTALISSIFLAVVLRKTEAYRAIKEIVFDILNKRMGHNE